MPDNHSSSARVCVCVCVCTTTRIRYCQTSGNSSLAVGWKLKGKMRGRERAGKQPKRERKYRRRESPEEASTTAMFRSRTPKTSSISKRRWKTSRQVKLKFFTVDEKCEVFRRRRRQSPEVRLQGRAVAVREGKAYRRWRWQRWRPEAGLGSRRRRPTAASKSIPIYIYIYVCKAS